MRNNNTTTKGEAMTLTEKIEDLKAELEESSSEQYKEAIRSQIKRLTNYLLTGSYSG